MINATQNAQSFFRNQHQAAESRQAGVYQAPTPSAGVLAAVPQARLGGVAKAADSAKSFKQELQMWLDRAPNPNYINRKYAARDMLNVYEKGLVELDLAYKEGVTCLPNLSWLSNLQTLKLCSNGLGISLESPQAVKAYFESLSQLSNLQTLDLGSNHLINLAENSQSAKVFFEGLAQLRNLQTLNLSNNFLGNLAQNPQAAKVFFEGLAQLRNLQTLDLSSNNLGALVKNSQVAKAFFDELGQLNNLQTLKLNHNNLDALTANPQAAEIFFEGLGRLSNLQTMILSSNNLGALVVNLQVAEAFSKGLCKLSNLQSLRVDNNGLGNLAENPQAAKVFFECFSQLRNLQTLNLSYNNLGDLIENPQVAKDLSEGLGQLHNLLELQLSQNKLGKLATYLQAANVLFSCLGQLSNLQILCLDDNDLGNLAKTPQAAKEFSESLGKLSNLKTLNLSHTKLGGLVANPQVAEAFSNGLCQLHNLQTLDLSYNDLNALVANPQAAKDFFEGLGQLCNLQTLRLEHSNLATLVGNPQAAEAFSKGLCLLNNLQNLSLHNNGLGNLAENPQVSKVFFEGLGQLRNLQTLDLSHNSFGALLALQAVKAIIECLGQLKNLQSLDLSYNDLNALVANPQAAKDFFEGLCKLSNLQSLNLQNNGIGNLAKNPQVAKAFSKGLGQLSNLQHLNLSCNDLGNLAENPQVAKLFFDGLGQLSNLQSLYLIYNKLLALGKNPQTVKAFIDGLEQLSNLQTIILHSNSTPGLVGRLEEIVNLRVVLRRHHIQSERLAIIDQGQRWSPAAAEKLFEQCSTVTDAVSAYELLSHVHDKGELSWPEVQSNLETVCLAVAKNLTDTDTQGKETLAKVRNQELAYLLNLVQHGAKIGALTTKSALNIQLHIQNNQRINQAFSAIQALQQNQQAMVCGLQAVGNALGQHIQHTAQLQEQYSDCFQQLANNQQQLQNKQKELASAHGSMRESLNAEIETLRSNQARIGDNLHQVGLKMLSAQRIRAIGSAVATGVAFLPWVGAGIAEAGRAIASAIGVANASGFASGLENLKDSLASMGSESIFQTPPAGLQEMTLGETLQGQGIELPDDSVTTQFTSIKLGDLADGIRLVSNVLANRQMEAAATTLAAFPEHLQKGSSALAALPAAPEEQADLDVAVPVGAGQHASEGLTPPAMPELTKSANSAGLANVPAGQPMQLNRMEAPEKPAGQASDQPSHSALLRTDSTGSLATVDEEKDELAAAIKFFDENNLYSVQQLNNMVQDAIADEQQALGSTSLTDKFLPTRNSNTRHATAVDLAAHYGRPQVLVALNTAARATRNAPTVVKLKSAQGKVFSRALSEATSRQGVYDSLGKRINQNGEKASKTEK